MARLQGSWVARYNRSLDIELSSLPCYIFDRGLLRDAEVMAVATTQIQKHLSGADQAAGEARVIAFASPKGGGGKTTLAILLACEFAHGGLSVAVLDADPQGSALLWQSRSTEAGATLEKVTVTAIKDAASLGEALQSSIDADVVIVDIQGTANETLAVAVGYADLVLIPTRPSLFDCVQAKALVTFLKALAARGHAIPYRVVFNAVEGIETSQVSFEEAVRFVMTNKLDVLGTVIRSRPTYKKVTNGHGMLRRLTGSETAPANAIDEAFRFAREVTDIIAGSAP
ncbi:MAG: AAA family ATPase [Beijerinckiaceae bacterium]